MEAGPKFSEPSWLRGWGDHKGRPYIITIGASAGARLGRTSQPEKIIAAEGFQCLNCQVEYYEDKRCSPPVQAARMTQ